MTPVENEHAAGASEVAAALMQHAIREIDAALGQGYASAHPELLATLVQVAGSIFLQRIKGAPAGYNRQRGRY